MALDLLREKTENQPVQRFGWIAWCILTLMFSHIVFGSISWDEALLEPTGLSTGVWVVLWSVMYGGSFLLVQIFYFFVFAQGSTKNWSYFREWTLTQNYRVSIMMFLLFGWGHLIYGLAQFSVIAANAPGFETTFNTEDPTAAIGPAGTYGTMEDAWICSHKFNFFFHLINFYLSVRWAYMFYHGLERTVEVGKKT